MQPATLPIREVGILNRKRRQESAFVLVKLADLRQQHPRRPSVRNDVMKKNEQHMLAVLGPVESGSQKRAGGRIKWLVNLGFDLAHQLALDFRI